MAISLYRQDMGKYPSADNDFADLKDYLDSGDGKRFSTDRWGRKLVYVVPGKHRAFDLYSFGANGIDEQGEGDDISNWAGIREGYYYKTTWPLGRRLLIFSLPAALACLGLGFFVPWRIAAPFSGLVLCAVMASAGYFLSSPAIGINDWASLLQFGAIALGLIFTIAFVTAFTGHPQQHA